jgi:hypothetical protein
VVEFISETQRFYLVPQGTIPMWPHQDGVREFKAGEELLAVFEVGPNAMYGLLSADGGAFDKLPPGEYLVSLRLKVPYNKRTERLRLSVFDVRAPDVHLTVTPGTEADVNE